MAIFGCCFGSEYKTERTWYPPLGRVLEDTGETVPTLRRISERRSEAPTFPPLTRPVRPGEGPTYPSLSYRKISERASIESPIHDAEIKVPDSDKLLNDQQKKLLQERMQEVHTFFYEKFGIEAVSPEEVFPPINGRKEGPDNAEWSNNVKEGWKFGSKFLTLETVAHEYIHAIVQRMTKLSSKGEEGALNESIADVFASIFKQYKAGQSVDKADWLMTKEDGSYRSVNAFPSKGKYPNMVGEVHGDAAIPNYAFYTAATKLGGNSWETMGKIWCEALKNTKSLKGVVSFPPFVSFAQETIAATKKLFPKKQFPQHEQIISEAWTQVGVDPDPKGYFVS